MRCGDVLNEEKRPKTAMEQKFCSSCAPTSSDFLHPIKGTPEDPGPGAPPAYKERAVQRARGVAATAQRSASTKLLDDHEGRIKSGRRDPLRLRRGVAPPALDARPAPEAARSGKGRLRRQKRKNKAARAGASTP